ncbi:MAG: hypothetical protein ACQR33_04965 [Candidatus Saccharibacteria bacterium]
MSLPVLRFPLRLISNVKIEVDYKGASQESLEPGGTVDFYDEGCLNAGTICTHESEIQKIYDTITLSPRFLDQQLGLDLSEDEGREP